jgi:hypothetical protein
MWALVINPVSGHGKGTTIGTYVACLLYTSDADDEMD